ncbi:hypothetical protein Pelo_7477 [Pelomyxa schiedti]|nr:hypothetical protein Pelo_7477 [Pelomyxa schiedti]
MPAFKAHVVVDLGISSVDIGAISPSRHCILHKKEMELFCKQCNEIICENCWAIGAHRKHECIDIFEARKLLVPQIGSKNEALLSSRRAELMTFRSQLETIKGETESEERNRCNVIKDTITHLHQLLEAKQKELCDFVEREQQVKVHKLEAQRKSINDHISVVECGISFTNMANQRVSDKDPFSFVSLGTVAIHATTLVSQFPSGSALVPSASARLEEAPLDGSHLATAIRDLTLLPPADASQSKLVEADTGPIFIRKDTTVVATIQTCDKTGKPSAYTSELTCSCKGPGNEVPAKIWVVENPENKGSGHLIVRMTPCEHGDYTLTAQINNTHIVGSPLTIFVADTKSAFPGSKILTTLELDNKLHEMVVDAEGAMGHRMINAKWRLLWRGSDHGFAAAKFHERCDNVAPTISIITVSPNYIFGGYTNIPYCSREGDIGGCGGHTFVYSLVYSGTKTGTIQKCTNHRSCIYFRPDWGPTYNCNGIDLVIHDNCNIRPFSTSGLALNSWAQPPPPNGIDKYVAGLHRFLVSNIEVWTPTQRS